jgi:hypothetical protein
MFERRHQWYQLPAKSPIDPEIAIGRKNPARLAGFRHTNQASIRKADWLIGILSEQLKYVGFIIFKREGEPNHSALQELQYRFRTDAF